MKTKNVLIICIVVVALLLGCVSLYGYNLYRERKEAEALEAARQAEIAAFYARPNIALVVTDQDISELELYTNLQSVDLSGSTCYDAIIRFANAHPSVDVIYTVELGGTAVKNDAASLELAAGTFDYDTLTENLQYLPQVTAVSLPDTDLTYAQVEALRAAYPDIPVDYTVNFLEQELTEDITTLDLSTMEIGQLDALRAVLEMLPNVDTLELMTAEGTSPLSKTDVKALMDAFPEMAVNYQFDFYGLSLSTTTEIVELNRADIGNQGEETIRQALDIMPGCTYMKLDDCGVDSDVMASIRDDYPNTKVVWRIFFGKYNCLTDAEMLRLTNGLKNEHVAELIYCTDVKYMDLGHNEKLSDISYIAYMPKLEILILSGSSVSDLSVFQDHPRIEFLELIYCGYVKDLSPLANCPNLKFLNVSNTKVKDVSPLDNVPLERFVAINTNMDSAQKTAFEQKHPECLTRYKGNAYGYVWRYVDDGRTFTEYYANMRVIFMYDDGAYVSGKEYKR